MRENERDWVKVQSSEKRLSEPMHEDTKAKFIINVILNIHLLY